MEGMKKFKGDFTSLWKLDVLPPIPRLSWWWWWVIIAVKDLTDMLKKNQEDFIKVIEEISILRKDMKQSRKPRVAHHDPDKDLNKPKD